MECPKCHSAMEEKTLSTLKGGVAVDQCTNCSGIWFDNGEAETLKEKWMSDYIDSGDPNVGRKYNNVRDVDCPRCGNKMDTVSDPDQPHIQYEICADHGMYFDAGEFTDYKYDTLMDIFRAFVFNLRKRG